MKSGNLKFQESSWPLQACNGSALPLPVPYDMASHPPKNHNLSVFPASCYSNCIFFFVSSPSIFLPSTFLCLIAFLISSCPSYQFIFSFTNLPVTDISFSLPLPSIQQYLCHCFSLPFSVRRGTICPVCHPLSKSGLPFLAIGEYQVLAISCRYSLPDLWHVALLLIMKLFDPDSTATRGPPGVFVFSVVTSSAWSEY
jgi:hypothetical protein